jgi:hypothetical protein
MTLTLKGIHGTAFYHAENIKKNGFIVPIEGEGKAGCGVYFWNYITVNNNATSLASAWWAFCCKQNMYDKEQDIKLVMFDVSIDIEPQNLLDISTNLEIHEAFLQAFPMGENESAYGAKLDLFITRLEQRLGCIYEIVRLNLSVPYLKKVPFSNSFPALVLKKQKNVIINAVIG